jgi:C-terminal processing protease CtpA/Prc
LELTQSFGSDRILIASDWEERISSGSELIAINGVTTEKLLKRAMDYACIEGDAEDARKSVAVSILTICAGLKIPYASTNQVRVVDFDTGDTLDVSLRGFQRKEFYRERARRHQQQHPSPVHLQLDAVNDIAILQVSTFAPNSSRKYRKQIADSFRKINESNHSNLIIDLRNNGGGSSSLVEYLYSFIDTSGYNTPSNVIARNSRLSNSRSRFMNSILADIIMALFYARDEDVQSFRHFANLGLGEIDTVYFKTPTKQISSAVFRGSCYVLINGLTASAAVDFTSAFRKRDRGTLVGRQCLGPITGTWGNPAMFTLPKTGLRVSIATIRYNYDNSFRYERAGIVPDHWVDRSAQDVHADRDSPVDFVINLIKN